jgi:hypothetical protein
MQLSEITIANQSFRKVGFLNASQADVFLDVSSTLFTLHAIAMFSRAKAFLTSSERSLRS